MKEHSSAIIKLVIFAFLLMATDLVSKYFVFEILLNHIELYKIIPGFNLVKVNNYGISFGIGQMHNLGWIFYPILSAIICLYLFFQFLKEYKIKLLFTAYILIIGGAIGNMIDRLIIGSVRDFIDIYAYNYHWPAFNLADSYICIGVFILLYSEIRYKSKHETKVSEGLK